MQLFYCDLKVISLCNVLILDSLWYLLVLKIIECQIFTPCPVKFSDLSYLHRYLNVLNWDLYKWIIKVYSDGVKTFAIKNCFFFPSWRNYSLQEFWPSPQSHVICPCHVLYPSSLQYTSSPWIEIKRCWKNIGN